MDNIGILILIVAAGAYWIFQSKDVSANISDKDLITAQRVDFPLIVSATGALEASRSVSITPPQVRRRSRFKLMRMVDEGTVVSEGDFLMELDTSEIARSLRDETANFQKVQEDRQNKRSNADINLKNLRLSIEQAKSDLQKLEVKMASQTGLVSGIEIEQTRIQLEAAKKNVEFLEKKLKYQTDSSQYNLQISRSKREPLPGRMEDSWMPWIPSRCVRRFREWSSTNRLEQRTRRDWQQRIPNECSHGDSGSVQHPGSLAGG